jgi:hypothetical protein
VICYFLSGAVFQVDVLGNGQVYGLAFQGNSVSIYAITIVNLRMLLETRNITWFIHLSYWISFALLLFVMGVESAAFSFTPDQFGVFEQYMSSGIFWLLYILIVVVGLLPAFVVKGLISMCWPSDSQIAREAERKIVRNERVTAGKREHFSSTPSVTKLVQKNMDEDADF